ncbi:MAG TPA: Rne/Rng family ribonuclease [Candidatus Acidoferrales bacterium]|nr:Rne/Rng family ribonuclease [Candidatus Acidoferrales bacterium]
MSKEMVISSNPHETRVAILEEGQLCEYYVEREKEFALVGSIYKGRVTRVLPGMQSAFVEIGLDSDAFLYVSDFLEGIEEFESTVTPVEEKIEKMEAEGGAVFAPEAPAAPAVEPPDVEAGPAAPAAVTPIGQLPGETIAPAIVPGQPHPSAPHERPHFGPAGRHGGHGRDFGRGGRGGRRGGRFGRGGRGGRGGDRRFGRELPSSKFASHRPYDGGAPEAGGEAQISELLPGEHLSGFHPHGEAAVPAPPAEPQAESPIQAAPPVETREHVREEGLHYEPEITRGFASSLEPLPGETLSKSQHHEPHVAAHAEPPVEEVSAEHLVIHEDPEKAHAEDLQEHLTADLTEEEASSIAEQVAEAQSEQIEREAEERILASPEHAPEAESVEEQEVEEEEEEAETEGMIAPTSEAEEAHERAFEAEHESDELAAAAEDAADAEAEAHEAIESLEETEHVLEAESGLPPIDDGLPVPEASPAAQEQQPWQARVTGDFRARMQHPARRGGRDRGRRDERGRRPYRGHHHRPPQRRPQLISELLKQGQEIIVQIAKEPLGKKGARITSHVALPGRYLVYMPTLDHTGVSRKIASAEERSRLRHLVNDAKGAAGGGFIVRTAASAASPDEVRADVEFLTRTWSEIKSRAEQRKAPSLLHRDLNLVERMLRDHISSDYSAIWVDVEEEYTKVVDFMNRFQPALVNRVKLYTKETPIFEEFGIQQEIDKGLRPKVWLKSGGYIVINHTEALVAIDVNTGKFVGKGSTRLEDTIVRTNLEAVKEIVRQMRLRDLGGIIIIDFIDMEERRNREKVMAALEEALKADRAPSKMLRFNEFGLIAITRKRTKQALERTLCQPCPYCTGSGMVKSVPTLCYEIQGEARKMAPDMDVASITLRVHPEIAKALKTRESSLVEELERWTKKSIIIQADPTLHWEQYDIY